MLEILYKGELLGDAERAVILCEYTKEMELLKRLIKISEKAVASKEQYNIWTHEGICFLFARSIVSYAKMAYDNMILGHYDATFMIIRTIIENNVCLDIIQSYAEKELWKYYLAQSFRNSLLCSGKKLIDGEKDLLEEMYIEHAIEEEFTKKSRKDDSRKPYAYIEKNYGWTYKINQNFSFSGLCALIDKREYNDFKMMSMYSHGTDIYLKINRSVFMGNIMNMISSIYVGIYRLVRIYCWDMVLDEFDEVAEEIEDILYDFLKQYV